jgi:rhamnopyranosyl-N-acetylglucosaminyl-diphospho-decaprenol beta-1,3/1,4-galactofuranosyltransferase
MKRAYEDGHDWIWVMDDDVMADPDCLEALLFRRPSRILVPVRELGRSTVEEGSAIRLDLRNPLRRWPKAGCVYEVYPLWDDLPEQLELQDLSFEGPLFHRSIPERAGFPRADFFWSFDDTEYACRARLLLGERIYLVKRALIRRLHPTSGTSSSPCWKQYCFLRNMLALRRTYGVNLLARYSGYVFLAASLIKLALRGQARSGVLRIYFHAALDSTRKPMPLRYGP